MFNDDIAQVLAFFAEKDADGISNLKKAKTRSKVIRRVAATDKNKSFEEASAGDYISPYPLGVVVENGKLCLSATAPR